MCPNGVLLHYVTPIIQSPNLGIVSFNLLLALVKFCMRVRAIITGATGMVGEGVLHECLNHENVQEVLVINRRPSGIKTS